jgi:hypothetical protein
MKRSASTPDADQEWREHRVAFAAVSNIITTDRLRLCREELGGAHMRQSRSAAGARRPATGMVGRCRTDSGMTEHGR